MAPLFTSRTRRRVSGAREGGAPTDAYLFCSFDPKINAILANLHAQLQGGDRRAQAEIDRYLAISPQAPHMIIPRDVAPHYDNLPDISYLTTGMLQTPVTTTHACDVDKQIYLLLRQCTPLRRRTKRAQREVMWKPESLSIMRVLLRCAHGTLLGLYPTSVRSVAFTWRRAIFATLRTLLVQPFEALNTCLSHMRYICKVCLMEHLCNTIQDYHPGLAYILNCRSGQLALFSQVSAANPKPT